MGIDIAETFYRYFEVIEANTPDLVDQTYQLRYQVYCVENAFEDPASFPDHREIDEYDGSRSVYSVIRHRQQGVITATVRLVLANDADISAPFPIENNCAESFESAGLATHLLPRAHIAEISRFAVSKNFKRRLGEAGTVAGIGPESANYTADDPSQGARVLPHLILGLFTAIVRMSAAKDVKVWYAVMEQPLLRLLTRFGIEFKPIGGLVDYHGLRQPCYGIINHVLAGIWEKRPDVWRMITDDGKVWPLPPNYQGDMSDFGETREGSA